MPRRPCLGCGELLPRGASGSWHYRCHPRKVGGRPFSGSRWEKVRQQVLARDRWTCSVEGCWVTHDLQIHHRVPVREGGSSALANLETRCPEHHLEAHR